MHKALMIDLETLARSPDAYILQVGFGVMDLDSGVYLQTPANLYLYDGSQVGRRIEPSTVRWWMEQDRSVQQAVFTRVAGASVTTQQLLGLLGDQAADTVWAAPATFDLPILADLAGGQDHLPWSYKQQRCLSTLWRTMDPAKALAPPDNRAQHLASADVDWQLQYLLNLWRHLERVQ